MLLTDRKTSLKKVYRYFVDSVEVILFKFSQNYDMVVRQVYMCMRLYVYMSASVVVLICEYQAQ